MTDPPTLQLEKERRVHWQTLTYTGMRLVDDILDKKLTKGEGTTEDKFVIDCEKARSKVERLEEVVEQLNGKILADSIELDTKTKLIELANEGYPMDDNLWAMMKKERDEAKAKVEQLERERTGLLASAILLEGERDEARDVARRIAVFVKTNPLRGFHSDYPWLEGE